MESKTGEISEDSQVLNSGAFCFLSYNSQRVAAPMLSGQDSRGPLDRPPGAFLEYQPGPKEQLPAVAEPPEECQCLVEGCAGNRLCSRKGTPK